MLIDAFNNSYKAKLLATVSSRCHFGQDNNLFGSYGLKQFTNLSLNAMVLFTGIESYFPFQQNKSVTVYKTKTKKQTYDKFLLKQPL